MAGSAGCHEDTRLQADPAAHILLCLSPGLEDLGNLSVSVPQGSAHKTERPDNISPLRGP